MQPLSSGAEPTLYDDYSILATRMPTGISAEVFLIEMLLDLNGTVNDSEFNTINRFKRKRRGSAVIGEIIEIDILGPDNGSVALAERASDYFVFQTVETPEQGQHPECGAREFGFERVTGQVGYVGGRHSAVLEVRDAVKFYTRAASRPLNNATRWVGSYVQQRGWTRLIIGIGNTIRRRGGTCVRDSISCTKRNGEA